MTHKKSEKKTSVTKTPSTKYRNRYQMSMDMMEKGSKKKSK